MRDRYFVAGQPAPSPHLARQYRRAALRIVLVTVPRVGRSCEQFPHGFDVHLLQLCDALTMVEKERLLNRQPTDPNSLHHRDDFSRPALRHGSLNSLF